MHLIKCFGNLIKRSKLNQPIKTNLIYLVYKIHDFVLESSAPNFDFLQFLDPKTSSDTGRNSN